MEMKMKLNSVTFLYCGT